MFHCATKDTELVESTTESTEEHTTEEITTVTTTVEEQPSALANITNDGCITNDAVVEATDYNDTKNELATMTKAITYDYLAMQ